MEMKQLEESTESVVAQELVVTLELAVTRELVQALELVAEATVAIVGQIVELTWKVVQVSLVWFFQALLDGTEAPEEAAVEEVAAMVVVLVAEEF